MDSGLHSIFVFATSVYSFKIIVSLCHVAAVVKGRMNEGFVFSCCRRLWQRSARGDGHGGVQSTWGRVLCGGGDLEPGRMHPLHLQEGTCPV